MSRHDGLYRDGGTFQGADGFDPDVPVEGYYRVRLRVGGIFVPVRLWWGPPLEPWTLEEMDRAPRWNALRNGEWCEVADVWPRCAKEPISEADANALLNLQKWGAENGHVALADPTKKIDHLTSPLMF